MIWFIIVVVGMVLLSVLSIWTGAECEQEVRAVRRWLARRLMPSSGIHGRLREVAASAQDGPGPRLATAVLGGAVPVGAGTGTAPGRLAPWAVPDGWATTERDGVRLLLPPALPVATGRHAQARPRYSNGRADLPVQPVETIDHAPWEAVTAAQPAIDVNEAGRLSQAMRP